MMSWLSRLLGRSAPPAAAPPAAAAAPASRPPPGSQGLPAAEFAGAREASRELLGFVMSSLKDERGIHLESLYCALGAVAGHACQASVSAAATAAGKAPDALFEVATTTDGGRYYFGDALNRPLAEDRISLWSLVAGAAAHDGAKQLPDLADIFRHNSAVLGSEQFGVPRLPPEHPVHARPIEYARKLWPEVLPIVTKLAGEPRLWPVSVGLAIQEVMEQAGAQLAPGMVARIVMESAIPVSKIPIDA
jgi:hypothetical protein